MDLSPKFQDQQVGDPVLLSVNFTVLPDILVENAAQGFADVVAADFETATVMIFVVEFVLPIIPFVIAPISSATVSVTLYFPAAAYECDAF